MNPMTSFLPRVAILLTIATALFVIASSARSIAAEQKPTKDAKPQKKEEKKPKKITGAELYAVHCNRCHPERYAPERTAAQWKTILTHMRVRANLPAEQAKAIMQFLQEDSGK